jgi:nucleoside-diphosphate-sugar epimerase
MRDFYRAKNLLVTGATGFIGTVLVDAALRKLPDIGRIYCIYRNKPGPRHPKVVWIKGDISLPAWGLDGEALAMLARDVHVVFHLAAYTRWDVGLQEQIRVNTFPVLEGAQLASQFHHLKAYVVTSSYWAACHLPSAQIAEAVYQDYSAEHELSTISAGDAARLCEWPNAYSYAKNLAERLLHERHPDMPIVLARVTSACGAWDFPSRGFCRFNNALPAFLRAITCGVRYFPDSMRTTINDSIPVDLCVNQLLANAVDRAEEHFSVIHCASAFRNLPPMGVLAELAGDIVYFPDCATLDAALAELENKRLAKLNKAILDAYAFAFGKTTVFLDHHARRPLKWMNEQERAHFPIDVDRVDWSELIKATVAALRRAEYA